MRLFVGFRWDNSLKKFPCMVRSVSDSATKSGQVNLTGYSDAYYLIPMKREIHWRWNLTVIINMNEIDD
jgi:hypothetical protein